MENHKKLQLIWWAYLIFYFALVLFNLDRIPVAWLDESYWLDVAHNLSNGSYTSKLWPHPGTSEKFLAYLPFMFFYDAAFMKLLPQGIFWFRLPYILAFVVAIVFLYKLYFKYYRLSMLATVVLVAVFMNDKGVYDSLRSTRSEVLELMLLAPAIYLFLQNKKSVWVALLLSLVFLSHPSLWVLVGILMLFLFFRENTANKIGVSAVFAIPVLAFLVYAEFDFALIKAQLIDHGGEHMAEGNLLIGHFWSRYMPFYKWQPWVPFLNLFILGYCIYAIYKDRSIKQRPLEVAFLLTSLYWLFVLAPLHRYNTPNILLMFMLLPKPLLLLKQRFYDALQAKQKIMAISIGGILLFPFAALVEFPFITRNLAAIVQREERNPYAAQAWLDNHFGNKKKVLLIDNSIAHYYALQHDNVEFTIIYSVYKYDFSAYDEVYLVSVNKSPVEGLSLVDEYTLKQETLGGYNLGSGIVTYNGLKLYKVNTAEQMRSLQRGYEQYARQN